MSLGLSTAAFADTTFKLKGFKIAISAPESFQVDGDTANDCKLAGKIDGKLVILHMSKQAAGDIAPEATLTDAFVTDYARGVAKNFDDFKLVKKTEDGVVGTQGRGI